MKIGKELVKVKCTPDELRVIYKILGGQRDADIEAININKSLYEKIYDDLYAVFKDGE